MRAGETGRALRRMALIGALAAAWIAYAAGVPASSGIEGLRAVLAKARPARPSSAKVSWEVEGAGADRPRRPEPPR